MQDPAVRLVWDEAPSPPPPLAVLSPAAAGSPEHRLIAGDNHAALSLLLPELEGRATLVYLDPPFLTGREHSRVHRARVDGEIERSANVAFDDRWADLGAYLSALKPRLELLFRCLSPDGSLVIHVDPKTSHYIKVMCDGLFGPESFASEIIWRYRRWPAKTANFQRVHDVLLRYTRGENRRPRFNQLYEPLAASTQKTWGAGRQRAVVGKAGRRVRSSTTEELSPGAPLGDVWDIGIVAPVARERTGYPTQKPEALLERLISALSDPGDLVLDPYMGSGTTLAVAAKLDRRSIGIDLGADSLQIAEARLRALGVDPTLQHVTPSVKSALRTTAPALPRERVSA